MSSRRIAPFVSGRRPIEITATRELAMSRAALFIFLAAPICSEQLVDLDPLKDPETQMGEALPTEATSTGDR